MLDIIKQKALSSQKKSLWFGCMALFSLFILFFVSGCSSKKSSELELRTLHTEETADENVPSLKVWYFEKDRILGFDREESLSKYINLIEGNKQYDERKTQLTRRLFTDIPAGPVPDTAIFYTSDSDNTEQFQERIWAPWSYQETDVFVLDQYPVSITWKAENTGSTGYSYNFIPEKDRSQQLCFFIDQVKIDIWQSEFILSENEELCCKAWYATPVENPVSASIRQAQFSLIETVAD